jgi:hypothetical protein
MKFKIVQWLAILLITVTGVLHLITAGEEYTEARYMGVLFLVNFLGSFVAAWGIYRKKIWWGWALGILIAGGSILGYIQSRTIGMPGMEVEEWANLSGIISLASGRNGLAESFKDICGVVYKESTGNLSSYGLVGFMAMSVESLFLMTFVLAKRWADSVLNENFITFDSTVKRVTGSRAFAPVMLVAVIMFGILSYQLGAQNGKAHESEHPLPERIISAETLEEEYGIRIQLVAVTAAGGMVDVRYRVIDPDKAAKLMVEDGGIMPMVYVYGSDTMLMPDMHMRTQKLIADRVYFDLIPNTQNAVKRGTVVTVAFGDVALEPMVTK